jgi:hypothetical protein
VLLVETSAGSVVADVLFVNRRVVSFKLSLNDVIFKLMSEFDEAGFEGIGSCRLLRNSSHISSFGSVFVLPGVDAALNELVLLKPL